MPNKEKEKSVKTVPKSNGNATTMNDAIHIEPMTEVIATDVKKGPNHKKKDKHKHKDAAKTNHNKASKQTSSENSNAGENGLDLASPHSNNDGDDDDDAEIRAVGEELLKRLQCNGTSISVRKTNDSVEKSACEIDSELKSLSSQPSKSAQKTKSANNNNNNNNNNSTAHNKNCQNQSNSTKNVNISSNSTETSSDGMAIFQCNGTHIVPTESSLNEALVLATESSSITDNIPTGNVEQSSVTAKESHSAAIPSCSNQHFSNQPSTSVSGTSEMQMHQPFTLPKSALSVKSIKTATVEVTFKEYENELQMPDIMRVIQRELSEPYSIYTYRYFIHNWPKLCFLAMDGENCIGAIVCKLDVHRQMTKRGYIAMLAVDAAYRKLKVGTTLVQKAIEAMLEHNADEVVLETEITNIPALRLYENLGFVRDKRLFDYYLNGVDALRLKLWFK